jgi:small subunit ribosomal protein S7
MGDIDGEQKELIKKLVNFRMIDGKITRVRAIVYKTFHRLARTDRDVIKLMVDAVDNIKPICEVVKVVVAITSSSGKNKRCAESPWAVEQKKLDVRKLKRKCNSRERVVSGTPGAGLNPGGMRGNRPLIKLVFKIKSKKKVKYRK